MFNNKTQDASKILIAVLNAIDDELNRVMQNNLQKEYPSPFENTGNKYKNNTFEVIAYNWNQHPLQKFNFKWKNFEISWYKYCGRSTTINKKISLKKINQMLNECLKSIIEKKDNYEKQQ